MKRRITFLALLLGITNCFAQTPTVKEIEDELQSHYSKIKGYRLDSDTGACTALEKENITFREKMREYTSKYPSTLNYNFTTLSNDVDIVTSADGLFRIYSWDTWLGGTMHDFANVFQFKSDDKVYSKVVHDTLSDGDNGDFPFYSNIFSLKTNNKVYYLAIGNGIYSTKDVGQSIRIFTIENNLLNDTIKLIKTKTDFTNAINVYFDFFSVYKRPKRPVQLIKYDADQKIISIPIIYEDGKVTDRFISYQFTGKYFEQVMTKKKAETGK